MAYSAGARAFSARKQDLGAKHMIPALPDILQFIALTAGPHIQYRALVRYTCYPFLTDALGACRKQSHSSKMRYSSRMEEACSNLKANRCV